MNTALRRIAGRLLIIALGLLVAVAAPAAQDYSAAEQALFLDDHLTTLKPPLTLHYSYRRSGSLEAPFQDSVDVTLTAQPDGSCCSAKARFLDGERAIQQPEIDGLKGNPAILYFLERDIHEMQRLTKGQPNYFRTRIRMAIYQSASMRDITLPYRGQPVAVREITITPYQDDPNRARFETLTNKQYAFMLSREVPGGVYGIRTRIAGASADVPPLIVEEMLLDGAAPAMPQRQL